jgi:hypothetical protein
VAALNTTGDSLPSEYRKPGFSFVDLWRDLRVNAKIVSLKESIRERLPLVLLTGISGAIGVLLASIYRDAIAPFLQNVLPAINNKTLLSLCLLLFLVCVVLAAWVCILVFGDEKSRLIKQHEKSERGFWVDKKTGVRVCGTCLLMRGIQSPISLGRIPAGAGTGAFPFTALKCSNADCGQFYTAIPEDYTKPKAQP